jgi:hypothetical protein
MFDQVGPPDDERCGIIRPHRRSPRDAGKNAPFE